MFWPWAPASGPIRRLVALVLELIKESSIPLVVDADGLEQRWSVRLSVLRSRQGTAVLTPHPGEAARLLETTAAKINADRLGAARALCSPSGGRRSAQGSWELSLPHRGVTDPHQPDRRRLSGRSGNRGRLTGMVAAFLGQGMEAMDAATLAAFLHGDSADRLAQRRGESGLLAGEIGEELPACMQALEKRKGAGWPTLDPDRVNSP